MSTSSASDAAFLELTFSRAFVIWWALVWRGALWGFAGGLPVGIAMEFIGKLAGITSVAVSYLSNSSAVIIAIPIGIYVVQRALRKQYREFSIRLIPAK